ncbi:Putative Endo-beta-1,4-glucanase A [Aspergillus calidoustus]|uniref:cellulase n=1 Tax=Aspergillus calidoustus TaxID=454130 RepID=A0A0U5GLA6_ASPCI|nr:Putative Endo-beta-1,4-glucanase A [Aspergillus calidoustus]
MLPRTHYLIAGLALGIPSQVAASFKWFGTSESGAEFGSAYPGTLGTDYTWPDLSKIKTLQNAGMNIFRVPFRMERLVPSSLSGPADATYLGDLKDLVNSITALGAYAVLDPHNYGRYFGNIITSTDDFAAFWTLVANEFADNDLVIFDTNNEYNSMDQTLVLNLNQAAIDAIRDVTTSQYIFVEGNSWSGAWDWTSYNDNLANLVDPSDKLIYEMHQYLDGDSSGTSETCTSSTIGSERLAKATAWLRENGKIGVLGEFAGGNNDVCKSAVTDLLNYLEDNEDVWHGALWWSAGPWWGDYMYSLEPASGVAYGAYLDLLSQYFPDGSSSSSPSSSSSSKTTTTTTTTTTTAKSASTTTTSATETTTKTTTTSAAETTTAPTTTTSAATTSTTTKTAKPVSDQTTSTSTSTSTTKTRTGCSAPSGTAERWGQCGGKGWTGPTACASPYTCQVQNDWYWQCL